MNDNNAPTNPKSKPFDVTPPGQSPPSSSSRPVIITNQPEQADPMLKEQTPVKVLNLDDLTIAGTDAKDEPPAGHTVTPALKKELTKLEKNQPNVQSTLVTVSSEALVKKPAWKKIAIISGVVVVLLGIIYYYR
jgi:hypothetical protein